MGMDLEPQAPTSDAPLHEDGSACWGRYNWAGWGWLLSNLEEWGLDLTEFSGSNDGDLISPETCIKVGDLLEEHLDELSEDDKEWIRPHVQLWRTCGGYRQY